MLTVAPLTGVAAAVLLIAGSHAGRLTVSVLAMPVVALALCAAAYRQLSVLACAADRPRPRRPAAGPPARSLFNLLPFLAVTATAGLVVDACPRAR